MQVIKSSTYKKYVSYFVCFGLVIAIISSAVSYWQVSHFQREMVEEKVDFQLERSKVASSFFINRLKNNVASLAQSVEVREYSDSRTSSNLLALEQLMLNLMKTNASIYQYRYIDARGNEIIKINSSLDDQKNLHYHLVPFEDLQNKRDRYYFQATKDLPNGKYFVSNLDLNKENGVYQIPYKPTLRVSTPVRNEQNELLGEIIANMDASYFLDVLTSFDGLDTYLIDADGYIVFSNHDELNWSRYLGKGSDSRDVLGLSLQDIKSSKHLNVSDLIGNSEQLRLVAYSTQEFASAIESQAIESTFLVIFIASVVAIPVGLLAAYTPSKTLNKLSKLTQEYELYSTIVDQYVPIVDTDMEGNITRINHAMSHLSGYRLTEVTGKPSSIFQHNSTEPKDFVEMWQAIKSGQSWNGELHNQHRNGESFWLQSYISPRFDKTGKKIGYIAVSSDITDKKRLENISSKDVLTGLYNRSQLNRVLDAEFKRSERYMTPFSILIIDIDHFKSVNDNYGHLVGDKVLCEVSNLLRYNVRQTDCVGRWGGEEFMVICPQTELNEGVVVAEKLRKSIEHFHFEGINSITISIGVAVFESFQTLEQIIETADNNLYSAKAAGRNRVVSRLQNYSINDTSVK